ncbi:sigma factor rpoE negative regulatory protein rseA [Vibrio ishigakensis]|uniref:Anti-sigma-E factor RseA n=1 Tax=Vibrio ishigakensis TaxID=1481914 RepID=A0A0B8QD50_9VIBR|nr:sigma factor rpoE negative regulatory protein rseA [Vibrio ishigakensis]
MSNKENISALLDGETIDKALLADLEHDKDAQQTWQNYHLIGDVMRGDAPQSADWDIASRVALALEDEPAHSTNVKPMMEPQPTPSQAKKALPQWLTQFGQVAVAACVSFAVIVGVQQYGGSIDGNGAEQSEIPVLQTVPLAGSVEPVSLTRESVRPQAETAASDEKIAEQRRRINTILQDYELQLRLNQGSEPSTQDSEIK